MYIRVAAFNGGKPNLRFSQKEFANAFELVKLSILQLVHIRILLL